MANSNSAETEHIRILMEFEADQAERNAKKMERAVEALERRYDPLARATQKHESAQKTLNRALEAGKITAERHAVAMAKVQKEYEDVQRAAGQATKVIAASNAAVNASTGFVGRNRAGFQMLGYQVQDFAVQVQGGTSVVTAFTQQGSQLLGVLGPIGAIMGAVLAVGLPLGAALFNMASGSGAVAVKAGDLDKAMGNLDAAMESYVRFTRTAATDTSTLYKEFGEFAGQIKGFSEFMSGIALAETFDALKASIAPLKGDLSSLEPLIQNVETAKQRLAAIPADDLWNISQAKDNLDLFQATLDEAVVKFGVLPEQAQSLITALNQVAGAKTIEEMGAAATIAVDVFKEIDATGLNIPAPLREAVKALEQMVESAGKAKQETIDIAAAVGTIDMSSADAQALSLAGSLGVALGVAQQLNATLNANAGISDKPSAVKRGGPALGFGGFGSALPGGVGTNEISYDSGPIVRIQNQQATAAMDWKPPKSKGGGGKSSGGKKTTPLLLTAETELQNLQRQIDLLGKTKAQVAELTMKQTLLDEAKKRGLDVDKAQGKSGMTLRKEIDAQAASVGKLTEEYERAKLSQDQFDKAIDDISGAMAGAILKGENFRESIANIFKSIAFDILKSGIKESISNVFATKATTGGGGSFLGNVLGGLFGGFRAGGGEVSSGKGYVVGEKGPEWFEPGSNGTIIPNHAIAPANIQAQGAGGTSVVQIILDQSLKGTILQQAAGHALEISGAAAKVQQRSLPAAMASIQARGAR